MDETLRAILRRAAAAREQQSEGVALPPARLVRFPSSHSLGALFVRRLFGDSDYAPWESWGNAQGEVAIPVGRELRLNVTPQASTDLSPLAGLRPDDVQYLQLSSTRINNTGLAHLGKLTGLRVLWLYDTAVSDMGLVHLRGLTGLRVLNLRSTLVTSAGVDALQEALPQCEFRRAWK
jgi:hypothetical protein